MKKLTILLFSILISLNSYGGFFTDLFNDIFSSSISTSNTRWTEIVEGRGGAFYLDYDTIKEKGEYVYYWQLIDFPKPNEIGTHSSKFYRQGDCGVSRYKTLSSSFYKQPMGEGSGRTNDEPDEWENSYPGSIGDHFLDEVCDYVD